MRTLALGERVRGHPCRLAGPLIPPVSSSHASRAFWGWPPTHTVARAPGGAGGGAARPRGTTGQRRGSALRPVGAPLRPSSRTGWGGGLDWAPRVTARASPPRGSGHVTHTLLTFDDCFLFSLHVS